MGNKLSKQNILFFTRNMGLGGTENVIIQLCEIFKPLANKIIVCSTYGQNVELLNKMGIKHYVIPDVQNKSIFNIIKISKLLKKIANDEEITIIHTHHRMAAFYVALSYIYKHTIFINTSHTIFFDKKLLSIYSYKHAYVIACGKSLYDNLLNYYKIDKNKLFLIENGINKFNLNTCVQNDLITKYKSDGYKVVINVGRLVESKGFYYYIDAAKKLVESNKKIIFLIVGTGDDEKVLKSLVAKYNLQNNVIFLGYREDVQSLMFQSDIVVSTSYFEGLPLNLIEAMSVKKPIIATNVVGNRDIVINGYNGILIKEKESDDLANTISELLNDNAKMLMFGQNSYELYNKYYTYDNFARKYIDLYNILCEKK